MTGHPRIHIAPIGRVSAATIAAVEGHIARVYRAEVRQQDAVLEPRLAFDRRRSQYNSTMLLEALHNGLGDGASKVVGITDLDLFIPIFTFVFGEAQLNGRVALASLFRLRNAFYGLPEDNELLIERLQKEVIHELGHTFGLVHCENPMCVMHASTAVEEVDVKGADLCGRCRSAIGLGGVS